MKFLVTLTVGVLSVGSAHASRAAVRPRAETAVSASQCLEEKQVPYKTSADAAYPGLIEPYNLRLAYKPAVVVLPNTNQHVQDAVVCAGQAGLKVQAKSGGHSYASISSGGQDGSLIVNLQPLQTIELDKSSGVVSVGGGVRLGNLGDGIFKQGNAAVAHGTCPGVGIGGHYTHGGYAWTSRNWGLALDQIVAADVVLANGTLVKASATEHSDIFWAIRGAAESFGVVTNFYIQTRPAPASIVYFQYSFQGVLNAQDTFTNAFLHIQDVAKNASVIDGKIGFGFYIDNYGTFNLQGSYFGSPDDFKAKVKPELLRTMPTSQETLESMSWYDFLVKLSNDDKITVSTTDYAQHENFYANSLTVPEADGGLTSNALNALYDHLKTAGDEEYYLIINLYGGPGSAINSKDTDFAAYQDRDSLWVFQNWGSRGQDSIEFIQGVNSAIVNAQPQTQFRGYLNYVDSTFDAATAHQMYYGDALYGRLAAQKKVLDPGNVFWNPQAIGA